MTDTIIDRVAETARVLIHALDHGSPQDVEAATGQLAHALDAMHAAGPISNTPDAVARIKDAISLAEAARVRVNYLTDLTRRRFEKLCAVAGRAQPGVTYNKFARIGRR